MIGLTALRVRGLMLAASTLAFAIAAQAYVFRQPILSLGRPTVRLPREDIGPFDLTHKNLGYYYFALALLVLPTFLSAAHAADVKGTTRIDAVTVFPSGAEVTRIGKVKLEGGDHVILFTDLPARAVHSSIRVEGKATGALVIGSVDSRRTFVPRTDDAVAHLETIERD